MRQNRTNQELLAGVKVGAQLGAKLAVRIFEVLAQVAVVSHQGQVSVVRDVGQLVVLAFHVRDVHVVGRGADVLVSGSGDKEIRRCYLYLTYNLRVSPQERKGQHVLS